MTDRELLKSAAKAAGMEFRIDKPTGMARARFPNSGDAFPVWNPLTDDGDALRLAVKLELAVHQIDTFVNVSRVSSDDGDEFIDIFEDYNDDAYAATRRAIVRAAAAIGDSK